MYFTSGIHFATFSDPACVPVSAVLRLLVYLAGLDPPCRRVHCYSHLISSAAETVSAQKAEDRWEPRGVWLPHLFNFGCWCARFRVLRCRPPRSLASSILRFLLGVIFLVPHVLLCTVRLRALHGLAFTFCHSPFQGGSRPDSGPVVRACLRFTSCQGV